MVLNGWNLKLKFLRDNSIFEDVMVMFKVN